MRTATGTARPKGQQRAASDESERPHSRSRAGAAQASATFEVGLICGHVADVPVYGSRHRKVSAGGGWMCRRCERVLTIVDVQGVPGEYDIEVSDLDRMASDL